MIGERVGFTRTDWRGLLMQGQPICRGHYIIGYLEKDGNDDQYGAVETIASYDGPDHPGG